MKTLKKDAKRWIAAGTLTAFALGSFATMSTPAQATGSKTWKKVAIGAGVVTGYGLVKGKGKVATIGAAATAGSYYMYRKKKKSEEQRRQEWYRNRYGRNWRNHYKSGH
jgi:acetyl-CoA carboxylase carboxyltransferase component